MRRLSRHVAWAAAATLLAVLGAGGTAAGGATARRADLPPGGSADVIVQGTGDASHVARAVRRLGGTVTRDLPLVRGVAATVPAGRLAALAGSPGVRAVTPNETVRVAGTTSDLNPTTIKSVFNQEIGADLLRAQGTTGRGVRVALVDTGISEVPDLAGRVVAIQDPGGTPEIFRGEVRCVDLSGEGDCVDRYGHGTFMAGLIGGTGAQSGGVFRGVAPGVEFVSVKIAGRNGAADVSKVLAAIQWVVSFRETYGIKVLNLSLGTNSKVPYWIDPLNFAVEQAWLAGITVVVAAGNLGPAAGTISKPGDDPFVITVGAVDDRETPAIDDDRLPKFSSVGPTQDEVGKPDLVAPGGRLVSLRLPDSYIEEQTGGGSLAGTQYSAYRRGSGTSMATAVVSGAVALLLERHPDWSPDRVKYAVTTTTRKVAARDPMQVGAGLIQVAAADVAPEGYANRNIPRLSDGTGTIDGSRGSVYVAGCRDAAACQRCEETGDCAEIRGERTAQGRQYDSEQYRGRDWTDASWYASQWSAPLLDTDWYGNSWLGNSWLGNSWLGNSWLGATWYGNDEPSTNYGRPAKGGAWYGAWG